mgnify:FL=1
MSGFLKTDIEFDYGEYGTEWKEKIEGLRFLCATFEGSCPGDRGFGLPPDILDGVSESQQVDYVMAVTEKIERYIPSLELVDVEFTVQEEGVLSAVLYIEPSYGEEDGEGDV